MNEIKNILLNKQTWENVRLGWELIEIIVIIGATLFTARWTFNTFGYREKNNALKKLLSLIEEYYKNLKSYFDLLDLKKIELKEKKINQEYLDNIEGLMVNYVKLIWHHKFEIENFIKINLDLNKNFKETFNKISEPLFVENILTDSFDDKKRGVYEEIIELILSESEKIKR